MYRPPRHKWRTFLRSPLADTFTCTLVFAMFLLIIFARGWPAIAAGAGLSLFLLSGLRLAVEADAVGIRVTNRFFRHRIRWGDVVYITASDRRGMVQLIPTIVVGRASAGLGNSLDAAVGLTPAQRREVALRLAQVAADAGYRFPVFGTNGEPLNDRARADKGQITG